MLTKSNLMNLQSNQRRRQMPYDTDEGIKSQQLYLPASITPLRRATDMNPKDVREERPSTRQQQKNGMGHSDLYPGFGKLLPFRQMNGNIDDIQPPKEDNEGNSSRKRQRPDEEPQEQDSNIPATEKPGRKRRRRSDPKHHANDAQDHHKPHREKSYVHHEYHDYSGLSGGPVVLPPLPKKGRGGVSSMFPTVLHHMLDDAEKLGFAHIVSWQPHGRAFHVHKPERFVAEVMTKYFRHTRLSSFQRQLSLYGFTRLARKGADRGAYYHECFLRGMMHLCSNMQRTRVKGTMVRQSSSPESEPDFVALPPVGAGNRIASTTYSSSNTMNIATNRQQQQQRVRETTSSLFAATATTSPKGDGEEANSYPMTMPELVAPARTTPPSPPLANLPGLSMGLLPTAGDQGGSGLDSPDVSSKQQGNYKRENSIAAGRPRGTKFMRCLLARGKTKEEEEADALMEAAQEQARTPPPAKSPDGSRCSSASTAKTQSSGGSKTRKVDADLAVFLEEVDLESEEDECLESEEAMARILEQDVSQISEV